MRKELELVIKDEVPAPRRPGVILGAPKAQDYFDRVALARWIHEHHDCPETDWGQVCMKAPS